ncbi:MAG: hypothetical protein WC373_17465 [Smithella sp.]
MVKPFSTRGLFDLAGKADLWVVVEKVRIAAGSAAEKTAVAGIAGIVTAEKMVTGSFGRMEHCHNSDNHSGGR